MTLNQDLIRKDFEKMAKTTKNREEKLKRDQFEIKMKNQKRVESMSYKQKDLQKRDRE
jgi:hypothetical protein